LATCFVLLSLSLREEYKLQMVENKSAKENMCIKINEAGWPFIILHN
jgi:hypothetical protein